VIGFKVVGFKVVGFKVVGFKCKLHKCGRLPRFIGKNEVGFNVPMRLPRRADLGLYQGTPLSGVLPKAKCA